MKKEKIAFILNYAPHYRLFIYNLLARNINIDFYFGDIPNSNIKKIRYEELLGFKKEFKTITYKSFYWYVSSISLIFKSYNKFVLTGDPQILSNWIFLIIARMMNKKTYLWTHGLYGKETKIQKRIKLIYFKLASKLLLYGDYSKNLLIHDGFKEEDLIVIYNSLDFEKQKNILSTLIKSDRYIKYFQNNNPILFYIGRIQKSKKLEQILEAMNILKSQNINTNFVLIGGKDIDYDFDQKVKENNLENLVWQVGPIYDEMIISQYIYDADICVSPGNVGLTALHSLAYGTPVITHNNFTKQMPEFETILDGVNGLFFKENDVNDLANKIKKLISKENRKDEVSRVIDEKWNPNNQIKIFKSQLSTN